MSRLPRLALFCLVCAAALASSGEVAANGAPVAQRTLTPLAEPLISGGAGPALRATAGAALPAKRGSAAEPAQYREAAAATVYLEAAAATVRARVRWQFRSASPVSGPPGVSADGSVYVASVEGYVHALGPDGSFRWSYGVRGIPLGPPAVDAAGRVYVATSEGRLYALSAAGQLDWAASVRGRSISAPVWAGGSVYLVTGDRQLYGIPGTGGASSLRDLGAPASAALASLGAGLIAIGTTDAAALLYRRAHVVARIELRAPLVQPLLGGSERWFAVTSDGLSAFDAGSHALLWSAPARRAALSADQRSLLVEADRELRWLSPQTGEVLGRAPLLGDVSAAPSLTNTGVALVPMVSGALRLVEPLGPGESPGEVGAVQIGAVEVAPAPLWAPVYDEGCGRVTVAAGGSVLALDLASASEPPARARVVGGGT